MISAMNNPTIVNPAIANNMTSVGVSVGFWITPAGQMLLHPLL
jgi:hypothetical protein